MYLHHIFYLSYHLFYMQYSIFKLYAFIFNITNYYLFFIIYFFHDLFTSQNERTPIYRRIEFVPYNQLPLTKEEVFDVIEMTRFPSFIIFVSFSGIFFVNTIKVSGSWHRGNFNSNFWTAHSTFPVPWIIIYATKAI